MLLGLVTVYATSAPGLHWPWLVLAGFGWVVLGIGWASVLCWAVVRRTMPRRGWAFCLVPPLIAALVCVLVYAGAPLWMRFELSRGDLDRFAAEVSRGGPLEEPGWIGLYPVEDVTGSHEAFAFTIVDTGFLERGGFAWSPHGAPDFGGTGFFTHFHGPWYIWTEPRWVNSAGRP